MGTEIGTESGTGVDAGVVTGDVTGAAESKTAGVVAVIGWTMDWVRAGVRKIVPWCSWWYPIFAALRATFRQMSLRAGAGAAVVGTGVGGVLTRRASAT